MSRLFAMAVPIIPGKEKEWKQWSDQLNTTYRNEFLASRKKLNVRERSFHQVTPMGEMVIVTLEGDNPEAAFQNFSNGNDEFTKWFLAGVKNVHGIDLTAPPEGELPSLVVDSQA